MGGDFYHVRQTPLDQTLADLEMAVEQLPYNTRGHEAHVLAEVLRQNAQRKYGTPAIGALLPVVLARLGVNPSEAEPETNVTETRTTEHRVRS